MTVSFGGLISGLDTSSLISQLVAAERASANTLTTKQSNLTAQKTLISGLSSSLSALGAAARAMDLDSEVSPRAATVSDKTVTMAVSSSATNAVHSLKVKSLAAAQVTASNTFASKDTAVGAAGTLNVTIGGTTKPVDYLATDTLDEIATKFNAAGTGATASVLFDGSQYRLMVIAKQTGTANAPTFTDSGGVLGLESPANIKIPASDAVVVVDGVEVKRSSNVIEDALSGVTMTLNSIHAADAPAATATVTLDKDGLTTKVKALVTAYNTVNNALGAQLSYAGTTKGANTLFGDSTLRQLQLSMSNMMTSAYGGQSLGDLGISRDKSGIMTLDESKLTAAIAKDPDVVSKLFVTNTFASTVGSLVDQYTTASTGILATKSQSMTDRHKVLQTQIDRIDRAADATQTRLEAQFSALERAMSALQNQSSYLLSALSR